MTVFHFTEKKLSLEKSTRAAKLQQVLMFDYEMSFMAHEHWAPDEGTVWEGWGTFRSWKLPGRRGSWVAGFEVL